MSQAAIQRALEIQQAKLEELRPGEMTMDDTTYSGGGLHIGALEQVQKADGSGWVSIQRFTLHVRKSLMPSPPAKRKTFTSNDKTWRTDETGGQGPTEIAWVIRGVRFPDSP
jgi:hypothetical protein